MVDLSNFFTAPIFAQSAFPSAPPQTGATMVPWNSLTEQQQNNLVRSARPLRDGPELNKFDESLYQYGTVHLPAGEGENDPRAYLGAPHNQLPPEIHRYDLPDGSVILQRQSDQIS